MSDLSALQQILAGLTSVDNAHRSQAEDALNLAIEQSPAGVLAALAQLGTSSPDGAVRSFALVLLRTLSLKSPPASMGSKCSSLASALSTPHLALVREPLLAALPTEADPAVRAKLASTVAGLAQAALDEKHLWAELGPVLLQMTQNSRADVRETVMRVWEDCPGLVAEEDPNGVKGVFTAALQDPESVEVRIAAFKGAISFLCDASSQVRNSSGDFVASMLNVLPSLTPEAQCPALQCLTTLSSSYPDLFKPHLSTFLPFLLTISHPPPLSTPAEIEELTIDLDGPAQAALEIVLELADSKPAPLRRLVLSSGEPFIKAAARLCLELIARLSDDLGDWSGRDSWEDEEDAEEEEEEWSRFGEEGLDRLAQGLGGKTVLPAVWPDVKALLEGESWKGKYAGLMAISSIAEGVAKEMEPQLGLVLSQIATLVNDEHPRVRYALVHCIGQLCTDFEYVLPQTYIDQVLPILLHTLSHPIPRVQAHSARAIVNLCDGLANEGGLNPPHLDSIVQALVSVLQADTSQEGVKAQIVTSLATVANAAGEGFGRFYGELMPVLIGVLDRGVGEPVVPGPDGEGTLGVEERRKRLMKAKVLECCGLMGLAVGSDMFRADAIRLAELMVRMQNSVIGDDDPQVSYLLLSWGKICEALGQDFAPYLPLVMPDLLKSASLTPDVSFVDDDEEESPAGWDNIVDIGGANVGIKTSSIEQTSNAFHLLVTYTSTLGGLFKPYMEETLNLSLKNLSFFFDDSVRESASIIIPILMKTAKDNGMVTEGLVTEVFEKLLSALAIEADASILSYFLKSVSDCIRVLTPANFPPSAREVLKKACENQVSDIADRRKLRAERAAEWDEEDREEAYELEREETVAINQMASALLQLDPNDPLLVTLSSVKDLGMAPSEEWSDEEDEANP